MYPFDDVIMICHPEYGNIPNIELCAAAIQRQSGPCIKIFINKLPCPRCDLVICISHQQNDFLYVVYFVEVSYFRGNVAWQLLIQLAMLQFTGKYISLSRYTQDRAADVCRAYIYSPVAQFPEYMYANCSVLWPWQFDSDYQIWTQDISLNLPKFWTHLISVKLGFWPL